MEIKQRERKLALCCIPHTEIACMRYTYSMITNTADIAATPLRKDALAILEAGYRAIDTKEAMRKRFWREDNTLFVGDTSYQLSQYAHVYVVAFGKCAADASSVVEEVLGSAITDGVVIDVRSGVGLSRLQYHEGSHPFPSEENVSATRNIEALLERATEKDLVIVIVSGGGSSLLCDPHDMTCATLSDITDALFRAGATIDELNTVRKHTSRVQGGQLAALAHPATVVSCVFSDVPGNDVSVIASGPTILDQTTREDAVDVLTKYDVLNTCTLPRCELVETPKDPMLFKHVYHALVVTNDTMLGAMASEAQKRGYDTRIVRRNVQGEARDVGAHIAREAIKKKTCLLYGGETTVSVGKACGKGGRNQEVALGALSYMMNKMDTSQKLVLAAGSDGWDNSPVAGAIADGYTAWSALLAGLDPLVYLGGHDTYTFFKEVGGHIITGRTGANVADVYMSLTEE